MMISYRTITERRNGPGGVLDVADGETVRQSYRVMRDEGVTPVTARVLILNLVHAGQFCAYRGAGQ
jgi:hypothetical protein